MKRVAAGLIACLVAAWLAGCGARQPLAADRLPEPFELSLYTKTTDGRSMYYELKRDGAMHYGGGRDANIRLAFPIGQTDLSQRLLVWRHLHEYELLHADGVFLPDPNDVQYELDLRAGSRRHAFKCVDDRVPGMAGLNDVLFTIQQDLRYNR